MKKVKTLVLVFLTGIQLTSCSDSNSIEKSIVDEILKGNVTSIGNSPSSSITLADLKGPNDVTVDQNGDAFIVDRTYIRKIKTSDGSNTIIDLAGNPGAVDTDGIGSLASFYSPNTLVFSPDYKTLYIGSLSKIRAINMATKEVTTLAGGSTWGTDDGIGTKAYFSNVIDMVINSKGTTLYISEQFGLTKRVRKMNIATNEVTTLTWNNLPSNFVGGNMVIDSKDENLYLGNDKVVLKMNLETNNVTVLVGNTEGGTLDGVGTNALFEAAYSLAFSPNETFLYVGQQNRGKRAIRAINMETKEVTTVTGANGTGHGFIDGNSSTAQFKGIYGMFYDKGSNKLYVADPFNKAIRVVN